MLETVNSTVSNYQDNGFTTLRTMNTDQQKKVEMFGKNWIYTLLKPWIGEDTSKYPIEQYHVWSRDLPADHRSAFRALNRYLYPDSELESCVVTPELTSFLLAIGVRKYRNWDDGWGYLGFRLIRPGAGDGYPFTAKQWGSAKGVVSFWIPVVGRSNRETLAIVPCSHLQEYPMSFETGKFAKDEPKFAGDSSKLTVFRPTLGSGEVIAYSSRTLHSEDVTDSNITRLNLEIRFQPV